jgi:hypothetical protein
MGRGDNRQSPKMRRKKGQAKKKARLNKKIEQAQKPKKKKS